MLNKSFMRVTWTRLHFEGTLGGCSMIKGDNNKNDERKSDNVKAKWTETDTCMFSVNFIESHSHIFMLYHYRIWNSCTHCAIRIFVLYYLIEWFSKRNQDNHRRHHHPQFLFRRGLLILCHGFLRPPSASAAAAAASASARFCARSWALASSCLAMFCILMRSMRSGA